MARPMSVLARALTAAIATAALSVTAHAVAVEAQSTKPSTIQQTKKDKDTDKTKDSTVMTVTPGAIAQNPATYYGKKVEVRAEVEDVLGRQVFLLDEDRLFAWPDVMVIAPALTGYAPEDEVVTVKGTVKPFVDADLRRDYAWNWWDDLETNIAVTFKDRPVIIADSIRTTTGTELVRSGTR